MGPGFWRSRVLIHEKKIGFVLQSQAPPHAAAEMLARSTHLLVRLRRRRPV